MVFPDFVYTLHRCRSFFHQHLHNVRRRKRAGWLSAPGFVDIERANFLLADDGHRLLTARKLAYLCVARDSYTGHGNELVFGERRLERIGGEDVWTRLAISDCLNAKSDSANDPAGCDSLKAEIKNSKKARLIGVRILAGKISCLC
jgi:hypothetical protein